VVPGHISCCVVSMTCRHKPRGLLAVLQRPPPFACPWVRLVSISWVIVVMTTCPPQVPGWLLGLWRFDRSPFYGIHKYLLTNCQTRNERKQKEPTNPGKKHKKSAASVSTVSALTAPALAAMTFRHLPQYRHRHRHLPLRWTLRIGKVAGDVLKKGGRQFAGMNFAQLSCSTPRREFKDEELDEITASVEQRGEGNNVLECRALPECYRRSARGRGRWRRRGCSERGGSGRMFMYICSIHP